MLERIARLAISAPRGVLTVAAALAVAAAVFGIPVAKTLCACGFEDPTSESSAAARLLSEKFGQGDVQMLIVVESPDGYRSAAARDVGTAIVDQLRRSPHVSSVTSPWTVPPSAATELISTDSSAGLIIAGITGGETGSQQHAKALSDEITGDRGEVTVRSGGVAMVNAQITTQSQHDLLLMESIAIPLSFLVLVWVFGGLLAAAVPVAVGGLAIVGALAVLRTVTVFTDVSIFALNLSAAMGLALAIDYTLLIISRYRDELAEGADRDSALTRTMVSAGRTVVFSATTVGLSMSVMALFPMHFLKSFAYAGVATVTFAALAAVVLTPAAIVVLGHRLDALDVRRLARRVLRRPEPVRRSVEQWFWYRSTTFVMRRAMPIGVGVVVLLLTLGAPFLGVKWGFPDDRVLPPSASARQVGDQLRTDFAGNSATGVSVVIPDAKGLPRSEIQRYADELARAPDVVNVSVTGEEQGSVLLTVDSSAPLFSDRSDIQLDRLHAVPRPGDRPVYIGGTAQANRDSVHAITSRLPVVLGLIAAIMFVLLLLLTGSVVLPLKALLLNALSLTAAFGAMVWIFQDGHLGALGTTPTGTLVANVPVLLFCIAFGLSMDYEVFLVSRIREFWLASGADGDARPPRVRNDESVALGIAHTGRVVTAAALVMTISFAALVAANVSFMRMFGLGLTLAVLVDATLVRMVLLPAFMHLMGQWNWWGPARLNRSTRPLVSKVCLPQA
ncbi:MMPL family transporter [Mycolicibacterium litorale]|uniref:Membrane protein n=1 Tax=Mycolicibacterium litorale TaxID=758802 RepID=A0AAD1IN11_9MYCO|nr:MMPL family transporter [Mycolicibacterium litorale]MCV7416549.1 MMPL family transporter [Mycolicibacterium litorale]TDY09800.1 RND superfamily putative drug exporter [Mycolicibacterium litorale]BBY17756.1 membrane protein [Mycolicibacterium litorale]